MDVGAAKSGAGRLGDFIDRGVVGQIRLEGEEVGRFSLLTRARRKRLQRLKISIDAGDLDACGQQAPCHRPPDAARRTGYDGHSLSFGHSWFLPCCRAYPTSILKGRVGAAVI
jgi:hypothetical protein